MSSETPPSSQGEVRGSTPSPIADLSYRNYDGPLHARAARWWIVALAGIRQARKLKGFWAVSTVAALPFIGLGVMLYFTSGAPQMGGANPFINDTPGQKYASIFFQAFSQQQLWLFLIALMVGAGSIAADNQTNALLVYLSKPITKSDYLLGKWMGIFLIVFAVAVVPAIGLYGYCFLSYLSSGFLRDEPLLLLRLLIAAAIPAAVHASLLTGFSAWSKTPRMAGAFYAGFYFVSLTAAMAVWGILTHGNLAKGTLVRHLSVSGVIEGLGQQVYGVTLRIPEFNRHRGSMEMVTLDAPPLWAMLVVAVALVALGVAAARSRIRAVEVVRG